jgi:holin (3TMs family)
MVSVDIGDAAKGVADSVSKIVGLFKKHPALAAQMEDQQTQRELQRDLQQILLNASEVAQGPFKGGWRPFIGWVCGAAFAYTYVLQPLLIFGFTMAGFGLEIADLPELKIWEILPIMGGMLGISYHRSGDKRAGVHKK